MKPTITILEIALLLFMARPEPVRAQIVPAVFCLALAGGAIAGVLYVEHCSAKKFFVARNIDDVTGLPEGDCYTIVLRCSDEAAKRGIVVVEGPYKSKQIADAHVEARNHPSFGFCVLGDEFKKTIHFESSTDLRIWKEVVSIESDPECFEVALENQIENRTTFVRAWY